MVEGRCGIVVVVTLACLLGACSEGTGQGGDDERERKAARENASDSPESGLSDFDAESNDRAYRLEENTLYVATERPDRLAPGRVVEVERSGSVRWPKVVEYLRSEDGRRLYRTEPATLAEAVPNGRFAFGSDQQQSFGRGPSNDRRTARQGLGGSGEEAADFDYETDLASVEALQLDGEGVDVETSGTLAAHPGYKAVFETSGGSTERFAFNVFDQPDLAVDWTIQIDGNAAEGPVELDGSASLCQSDGCRGSFEIRGREFLVEPRVSLGLRAEELESGTFELSLADVPSTHYLLGGGRYTDNTGWKTRKSEAFAVETDEVASSEGVRGKFQITLELAYVLRPANEKRTMARVELMELYDDVAVEVAPPECFAAQRAEIRGNLRRSSTPSNPTCLGAGSDCLEKFELFDDRAMTSKHDFAGEVGGCQLKAPKCDALETAKDCPGSEQVCALDRCIREAPVRIALTWRKNVDLELVVWDDGERRLEPPGSGFKADIDGWIAHRSAGEGGSASSYAEIALLREVGAKRPIEFQVRRPGWSPTGPREETDDSEIGYELRIQHAGKWDRPRTISSTLDNRARSVRYRLESERGVTPGMVGE